MSRLIHFWSRFFLKASPLRTYAETLLLFVLLMVFIILVYESRAAEMTTSSLMFFINPCVSLYYSLRLRVPVGRWYRRVGQDLIWLAVPTLLFNPLIWITTRMSLFDAYAANTDIRTGDF